MAFLKKAVKGAGWVGGLRMTSRVLSLLKTAVLARLLDPAQFGVFGVITLTIALFEILMETGVNTVLIQEEEDIDSFINTAWLISIIRGMIIALAITLFAYPVSRFFASPQVLRLLLWSSLVPLIRGFINPAMVKFQKNLEFQKEFYFRFSILTFESLMAIAGAILTHSVASLVLALVFSAGFEVILSFLFCQPRPQLSWDNKKAGKIVSMGKWVTLNGIFSYLVAQGDDAVVGRLLGMENLGLYQLAYKISNLPFTEVTDVVSRVVFPVYSKISQDKARVERAFRKSLLGITFLVIPGVIIIFLFPETVIRIVLGEKWLGAAQALRILAFFGLTRAIGGSVQPVLYAFKKQSLAAKISLVKLLFMAALIIPLTLKLGIAGTAMAVLVSSLLVQPLIWKSVKNVLGR
jgi:O-antigen/teichoic acid export membrane protein